MKNFRDIENLSAYLDGQLDAAEAAKVESRLKSDPELASAMSDLRASRNILRKLPARKAPRNFTLTRQMVGLKPPMPRSYPLLRFATVFAAILFMCSFTTNVLTPMFGFGFGGAAAPAPLGYGGGGCDEPCEAPAAAMEESAATEEAPLMELAPAVTETPAVAEDSTRIESPETQITPKNGATEAPAQEPAPETANQAPAEGEAPAPFNWTLLFLVVAILGGAAMWVVRRSALRKWR